MSCAPSEDVSGSRGYLGSPVSLRSLELAYRTTAVGGASGPATPSGIERIRVRVGTNGYATSISASNLDGVLSRRPATTTAACEQWLDDWGLLLGVEDVRLELVSRRRILDRGGAERIRFSQVHPVDGTPVFHSAVTCHFNAAGRLWKVTSTGAPAFSLPSPSEGAALDAGVARTRLDRLLRSGETLDPMPIRLGILFVDGEGYPVYRAHVSAGATGREVFIDAGTGALRAQIQRERRAHERDTYFGDYVYKPDQFPTPYALAREVGPGVDDSFLGCPSSCPGTSGIVDEGTVLTDSYYRDRFGRDGWDDNTVPATLHRWRATSDVGPSGERNAFWNPLSVFEGQWSAATYFGPEAACVDVIGHEFTHGVSDAELIAWTPPNMFDEALSDVFGQYIERDAMGSTDWIVGTGGTCTPYRDIVSPESPSCGGCLVGTAHYSNLNRWEDAPGSGVHAYANSFVVSHAAYLGSRPPLGGPVNHAGIGVNGIGDKFDDVMYELVADQLDGTETHADFAAAWKDAAYFSLGPGPDYWDVLDAVDASGMWTGTFLYTDPRPADRMAFATFSAEPDALTWVFLRNQDGFLRMLAYPCTLASVENSCWPVHDQLLAKTSHGPGAVVHGGELYVFFVDPNRGDEVSYFKIVSSGAVIGPVPMGVYGGSDVDAESYGGDLFVFYRHRDQPVVRYSQRIGSTWQPEQTVPEAYTNEGPAVAALNDRLNLFFTTPDGTPNLRHSWWNGSAWVGPTTPPRQTEAPLIGSPTATAFQNRTHVAGVSANGVVRYASYCRESDGCQYRIGEWTQTVEYDQDASVAATLHHDDGLVSSGYGPYLYLLWETSTFAGQPLEQPMLVWQYKRSE